MKYEFGFSVDFLYVDCAEPFKKIKIKLNKIISKKNKLKITLTIQFH